MAQHKDQFEKGRCLITADDMKQFELCFDKLMDLIANVELDAVIGNGSEFNKYFYLNGLYHFLSKMFQI